MMSVISGHDASKKLNLLFQKRSAEGQQKYLNNVLAFICMIVAFIGIRPPREFQSVPRAKLYLGPL